ncbi:hypothetical protein BBP00_00000952 [Phytophthora kernoviae]|uniref:Peptidase M20 dimerisation domain-containing protein n=3 Tax=Phytophthora kernoviae TaxID=325452 RepID=A0A3F2S1Q3_9STRA|nr:hypothetical protein BBP00_00000952 [Phytophthora kernoviae]
MASPLQDITLDETAYVELLRKVIGVAEKVQNAPSLGLIPQENLVSDIILAELAPYTTNKGGYLTVERVEFIPGRGNVIITYQHPEFAHIEKTVAYVGSHMDVVPANPEGWQRDPFTLTVEGDKLYGRGTTDCLGHVVLMAEFFKELAKRKVRLETKVVCVLIASEENTEIPGVGVETLMESGKIDFIKNGPVIWVDCSDSQPCIGTAGVITWTLKATGKLFHSGLPNLGINGIELGMDALTKIQEYFYQEFGPVEKEKEYNYSCPSTMKPTRIESSTNGLNQIPPWVKISGDVRLSPFYDMKDLIAKMQSCVADLNANITSLEGKRGPVSKYTLPDENWNGKLELTFDKEYFEGIACSLDSVGYKSMHAAISDVLGEAKPFSISGSLPLVRDLQRAGLDLTLVGFGKSSVYHGDNEYCQLSDMKDGIKILARTVANVDAATSTAMATLQNFELNEDKYVELLRKLISVSEKVQNAPGLGLIPQENLVSDFVLAELAPYTQDKNTHLTVERVEFTAGRGNVIIKYQPPSASDKTVALVGAHMDVVPANPEGWQRDPFTLTKVATKTQVVCVLIASEENSEIPGVGVETLMESGKMNFIKNGPVFWVDCSDSQPCIGTAGAITWTLKATGKLFHSGLPNLGINGIELGMDALTKIQEYFYQEFGPVEKEKEYNYSCPSTMKPTRIESSVNGLNQIPPWTKIAGDVRLSPFYDMKEMISKMTVFVDKLNADITSLEGKRGPVSKYTLPDEGRDGKLELVFDKNFYEGIACSLDSAGYKALHSAIGNVLGEAKPFSISGSLPLVRDMQRGGFDLTLVGFGKSSVYHGDNEYCQLSDMKDALKILALTIANVDTIQA